MKKTAVQYTYFWMCLSLVAAACSEQDPVSECSSVNIVCEEGTARCMNGNTELCLTGADSCPAWVREDTNLLECSLCPESCVAGERQCIDGKSIVCQPDTKGCYGWVDIGTCQEPCAGDNCQPCSHDCQPGDEKCVNGTLNKCELGSNGCYAWVSGGACSVQTCQNECNTSGDQRCHAKTVQTCQMGESGCLEWVDSEVCSVACRNSSCQSCAVSCIVDSYSCAGKTLQKCVQDGECTVWQDVKSCNAHCDANARGCTEDLPACTIKSGSKATILQWTDGDTLWVRAASDGKCNAFEYTADKSGNYAWRNVRYNIRIEGIDAPECEKAKNNYHYYVCTQDTSYNSENERYGYESWVAASEMLPFGSEVIISCDNTLSDGTCKFDNTQSRRLAYIGFEKNNTTYDYSTEIARMGLAFANVEFAKTTSIIGQICAAQKEAIQSRTGLWSLSSSVSGVLNMMGKSKQNKLKNLESRCDSYIK